MKFLSYNMLQDLLHIILGHDISNKLLVSQPYLVLTFVSLSLLKQQQQQQ